MPREIVLHSSSFDELRGTIDGRKAYSLAGEPFWHLVDDETPSLVCRCGGDAFQIHEPSMGDVIAVCVACGKRGTASG